MGGNIPAIVYNNFFLTKALLITSLVHIPLNKMGWLRGNIDILWKPQSLYCTQANSHLNFGLMHV
jgi:hypothetical protein